ECRASPLSRACAAHGRAMGLPRLQARRGSTAPGASRSHRADHLFLRARSRRLKSEMWTCSVATLALTSGARERATIDDQVSVVILQLVDLVRHLEVRGRA